MTDDKKINWQKVKLQLKTYFKNYWWKYIIIAVLIAVDLVLKAIIVPQDQSKWQSVDIIKNVVSITPARNIGAGFSILEGKLWFLISITILFIIILAIFDIMYQKKSKLFGVSTALVMAGAVGNLIDRILFGYVRDFIYLDFINFPVFNVADMSLTFGIILLVIYIIFFATKNEIGTKSQKDISKANISNKNLPNDDAKSFETNKTDSVENNNKNYISENKSQIESGENNAKNID